MWSYRSPRLILRNTGLWSADVSCPVAIRVTVLTELPLVTARFQTPRRLYRATDGDLACSIFEAMIGSPPMPHQRHFFELMGEMLTVEEAASKGVPAGTYAYREGGLAIMRQCGKTVVDLAQMVKAALVSAGQKVMFTAQSGKDAREKLINDFWPLIKNCAAVKAYVRRIYQGVGSEKIDFLNDSMILIGNSNESASHGKTLHFAVMDEIFADIDNRREGALLPALMTVTNAQLLWSSAAGTGASLFMKHKVKVGRQAARADSGYGICYQEFSAPHEARTYDEDAWAACHPALGRTVSLVAMRHAADSMDEAEFRRAWLNIPTERVEDQYLPADLWEAACDPSHSAQDAVEKVWSVDVALDRGSACVGLYGADVGVAELVHSGEGLGWVAEKAEALVSAHGGTVVFDRSGPAANIAASSWIGLGSGEVAQACADFYDGIVSGDLKVRSADVLDTAVAGAEVRQSGDRWAWSRKQSVSDVTSLFALTLACKSNVAVGGLVEPFVLV